MRDRARPLRRHLSRQGDVDRTFEDEEVAGKRRHVDSSHRPDPRDVLGLQRTYGNRAVQRWISGPRSEPQPNTYSMTNAQPFVATIKCADSDAEPGEEEPKPLDPPAVLEALAKTQEPIDDLEDGKSMQLPDIAIPETIPLTDNDTVGSTLAYVASITQAGVPSSPTKFGSTRWSNFNLTNITVARAGGVFTVRAVLMNPITFSVQSRGRTNIASENDAALTDDNYPTAASDLTPNMGSINGRPARTEFWAEDLTIRHERFHANERFHFAQLGTATAQAWLSAQVASSVGDVRRLLNQVPPRVIASSQAAMPMPGKEERAYGDDAPFYKVRADAIKAKGDKGLYP
jgi:hypothetical protein